MRNNENGFVNPLSELISDEIYGLLKSKNLINEKTLRDYQIKKRFKELRENNYEYSINIFRINVALYSNSSNVYDSLGEAYMKKGDTAQAIVNYKKSLELIFDADFAKANCFSNFLFFV